MTWVRLKRAIWETREFDGRRVQHVIGWEGVRSNCGCYWVQGMRLDKHENTFGAGACERHGAQLRRAMETIKLMPPSERVMFELLQEQLDHEIGFD